jgi:peptidoglycan/xylan/chitin deacetylase (PgdA/CDA1 family)
MPHTTTQPLYWSLRSRLSPSARGAVRRATDSLLAPVGSLRGVRATQPIVALTFDDGPEAAGTPGVLAALGDAGARATFFLLVERAEAAPELARAIVAQGHEVGLHGIDHARLTGLPPAQVARRLHEGRRRLEAVVARPVRFFRPPYGSQSLRTYLAARRAGLEVVVWTADDPARRHPAAARRLGGGGGAGRPGARA